VLEWVVRCRCLLLFLICCISFGPFCHRHVAIDFVLRLCCFARNLLAVEFDSENLIWNMLMFSGGMGFSNLGLLFDVFVFFFNIMLFGGMLRLIG
jgi:hypothetical protein